MTVLTPDSTEESAEFCRILTPLAVADELPVLPDLLLPLWLALKGRNVPGSNLATSGDEPLRSHCKVSVRAYQIVTL